MTRKTVVNDESFLSF